MSGRTAQDLILHCNKLKADRLPYERNWQEIAYHMRPLRTFMLSPRISRGKPPTPILDSTALTAA